MLTAFGGRTTTTHMAVTRADVAKLAGVSPAVVSYVMNPGSRPVSPDARRSIEAAIQELNYRPNAIAQALRRSSTMSIGLMVPDLANPLIAAVTREIEDVAYDLGYVMFVGTVGHDPKREERYVRNYVDRKVDALVVVGAHRSDVLQEMSDQGVPVLVLDRIEPGMGLSSVHPETRVSARLAVEHLIEVHGHTRIACVGGPETVGGSAQDRVLGWRDALEAASLPSGDELLFRASAFTRSAGYSAALTMLDESEVTAVFVSSDVQAVGVIGAIRERALLVPGDIAITSFDGSELAARAFPGLTSVDVRVDLLAQKTVERLMAKLDKSDLSETHDVIPTELVVRRSCGCEVPIGPVG